MLYEAEKFVKIHLHIKERSEYEKNNSIVNYYAFTEQLRFSDSNGRSRNIKNNGVKKKIIIFRDQFILVSYFINFYIQILFENN